MTNPNILSLSNEDLAAVEANWTHFDAGSGMVESVVADIDLRGTDQEDALSRVLASEEFAAGLRKVLEDGGSEEDPRAIDAAVFGAAATLKEAFPMGLGDQV